MSAEPQPQPAAMTDSSHTDPTVASAPATTATAAAVTSAAAASSDRVHRSDEERRAFYAASNARRKARELAKHEARQLALQGAKSDKAKRDAMEALQWCRAHLQLEENARGLRDSGAMREQRSIILLQFSGTNYKGMQIQNRSQVATIEGALLHALYRAGAISDDPELTLQQLRWQRTARTDSGVHAAFNVVSCILQVDESEALCQRLNALLPADMHVLDILPVADLSTYAASTAAAAAAAAATDGCAAASGASSASDAAVSIAAPAHPSVAALDTHGFHAKESCTGRAYEYLMPSAVWGMCAPVVTAAQQPSAAVATPVPSSSPSASASPPPASTPSPRAGTPSSSSRSPAPAAASSSKGASSSSKKPPSLPFSPLFSSTGVAAAASAASFSFDYDSFVRARLAPDQVEHINGVLAQLQGEKISFHNFAKPDVASIVKVCAAATNTPATEEWAGQPVGAAADVVVSPSFSASPSPSPSASPASAGGPSSSPVAVAVPVAEDYRRTVSRCRISEVFVRADDGDGGPGVEYCRVLIDGKSFMLHQIRKMMSLAVLVVRGMARPDIFGTVFEPGVWYDMPIAPARGLLLRRPFFDYYDEACERTDQTHAAIGRAYERLQTDIGAFQSSVLEAEICSARPSHSAYRIWIKSLHDQANLQFRRSAQQVQMQATE